jgi:hypothetical protein
MKGMRLESRGMAVARVVGGVLLAACAAADGVAAQGRGTETARMALERLSRAIVIYGPEQFLYGFRSGRGIPGPPKSQAAVKEFASRAEGHAWSADDLRPLLKHRDAKVRTLALVAVFALEDPRLLTEIFQATRDGTSTFPRVMHVAHAMIPLNPVPPKSLQRQTVGQLATSMLDMYLESGGYFYGPEGRHDNPGFNEYLKAHAGRTWSAGWMGVRLARAGHSTSPTPEERYGAIRRLRADIDRIGDPDRTHVLMWLKGEPGSDVLVSERELVELAQRLGPDNLLAILRRQIRSDDPALQASVRNRHPYARMCVFILQHARTLLRPTDAQTLLDQETRENDFQKHDILEPLRTPWWAIAAAELNPGDAGATIVAAHKRFSGDFDSEKRLELTLAAWRLIGESFTTTVADWFYREMDAPHHATWGVSRTLEGLLGMPDRQNKRLARVLVEDPRFDRINSKSLESFVRIMNRWSGKEIVPTAELEQPYSPSIDFFFRDLARLQKDYPQATPRLLETLARWRRAIRENAPAVLGE